MKKGDEHIVSLFKEEYINKKELYVKRWIINNPIDYWWRKKYNVPFNSKQHREVSMEDMLHEYLEDRLIEKWSKKEKGDVEEDLNEDFSENEIEQLYNMSEDEILKLAEKDR